MVFFIRYHYSVHEEKISRAVRNNCELVVGMLIASVLGIAIELPTWLARTVTWTVHISNTKGVVLAAWLPQIFFYIFVVFTNIIHHVKFVRVSSSVDSAENSRNRCNRFFNITLRGFSSNSNVHVILVFSLVLFGLLYTLLPAIILTLTYPMQMISMFAFV